MGLEIVDVFRQGWVVCAYIRRIADHYVENRRLAVRARGAADGIGRDRFVATLDGSAVADGLGVRTRRPGDRLQPHGMAPHHKTLQDLFVDAHVPRRERDGWPVVVCGDRVVWVPGVCLDARAAVRPETIRVVVLTARPPARAAGVP